MTLYFPKESSLVSDFDRVIGRLNSAGLIDKWKRDEMDKVSLERSTETLLVEREILSAEDVSVAFMVIGLGILFAVAAFVGEVIISAKR